MKNKVPIFERRGSSRELVVLLHAYTQSRQHLRTLRDRVAAAKPNADILVPDLPLGLFSFADCNDVVADLLRRIDHCWAEQGPYSSVVLIGHSMGALLARKLYVCACGENPEAPFDPRLGAGEPRAWAGHVKRVILLAGMNRGWAINHHLSLLNAVLWTLGILIGRALSLFRPGRQPIILSIQRGAVFIAELRLQWLLMRQRANDQPPDQERPGDALTIQLLGSIDDMVSPGDNIDLISGRDFVYLDVPHSGHANVIEMDDSAKGRERAAVFTRALTAPRETLEAEQTLPADSAFGEPRPEVTDVIFVIHGIRDAGYWTHKVARRVREKGKRLGRIVATETSSYGYFPMLRFILPGERRTKTQWFMDQYVEACALYPRARFSFIGHSNGTYLLASALRDYRCCRFDRVVFAGSVVRRQYDWDRYIASGQVRRVANYVASADWVVAFFPKAMQTLRWQDLGSAGHDGFVSPSVSQVTYVRGAHSAALNEDNWNAIADFILGEEGNEAHASPQLIRRHRNLLVWLPGLLAPLIWVLIATLLIAIGYAILRTHTNLGWAQWQTTVLMVGYVMAVWTVLTKL
ncbi:hypothetical protein GCM10011348_16980 [Marinobacterium nitratireducens]|uniref:AB hydrolase-1 domain-containing protein n=1 Tax=Marinobacterium nitratireducens TaxID=518897 RepID=A0A917ZBX1_9GAMM|nr:alpha/beta fold hydrolase [Marinobacterium nitratireducens]GGO80403.1 hypothetical protein GCM10011348_16980 [Marinobacterium nitratireducens]